MGGARGPGRALTDPTARTSGRASPSPRAPAVRAGRSRGCDLVEGLQERRVGVDVPTRQARPCAIRSTLTSSNAGRGALARCLRHRRADRRYSSGRCARAWCASATMATGDHECPHQRRPHHRARRSRTGGDGKEVVVEVFVCPTGDARCARGSPPVPRRRRHGDPGRARRRAVGARHARRAPGAARGVHAARDLDRTGLRRPDTGTHGALVETVAALHPRQEVQVTSEG